MLAKTMTLRKRYDLAIGIGVLTGGGDAPGLDPVIRAIVKAAVNVGAEVRRARSQF
jgi:6-phosphofructokinase